MSKNRVKSSQLMLLNEIRDFNIFNQERQHLPFKSFRIIQNPKLRQTRSLILRSEKDKTNLWNADNFLYDIWN